MESSPELIEQLRVRVAERIPNPGSEADTMFLDAELAEVITVSGTLLQATVLAWQMKVANLSHLVDVEEGDSKRKLSQRFEQARKMLAVWQTQLGTYEGDPDARVAVVGAPIEYLRPNKDEPTDPPHPFPNYPFGF